MTSLTINGVVAELVEHPLTRLSDALRGQMGLTGTKVGCNTGDCGACTVLLDGEPVCSCLTALGQVQGCHIETVEAMGTDGLLSQLQQSFLHYGAAQCGICTPGMLMSAKSLLTATPEPSQRQVEDALGGVLCRCTGYRKIVQAVMHATRFAEDDLVPTAGHNVGVAIRHLDGEPKVRGTLKFGADSVPADALALRLVRSEHHAASFIIGDTQAFIESHEGVECVLDASDIRGVNCFGVIPPFADQPVFAEKRVLYRGEAVAAVVGDPAAIADLDLSTFPIEWQVMDALLTPGQAMNASTSTLHEQREHNILTRGLVERGDVSEAFVNCTHSTTVTSSTPFIEHGYIEPEAGYAQRIGDRLEIHGCTQAAQMDREAVADIMGLEITDIRVVPSACGGGFGSKIDVSFQPYIAMAAWVTRKPVSVCYTRPESMRSTTKRHPSAITLKVGCDEHGKINAFDFEGTFNTGAYASWGPTVANRVPVHASGPYYIPHYRARSLAVHTNTSPAGAFRGFGVPQSAIAQECAFDELADQVGMDKLEFRMRNALRNGEPTVTGQVFESGVGIMECLQALKPAWDRALQKVAQYNADNENAALRKGVGVATCWYGCGNTSLPNPSTIRFGIKPSGEIVLHQGAMDIGQGSNTVITQIAADALGVSVHDITLIDGDTDLTPDCGKTSASRQTFITGAAAKLSGEALRAQIMRHANVGADAKLHFTGGGIELQGTLQADSPLVRLKLANMPVNEFGYVFMTEETYDPVTKPLDEKGQGVPYALYGYGAQLIELSVDTRLGTLSLDHITTAHDVGKAINPMLVEGQIEGGVAQGIGMALMEDYQPGRTENLHDYLMPTVGDMPEFTHIIVEVEDPVGPYGAKGLGEHVLIPTAPAIVNAIRHATGALVRDLPATPDKVLAAIQAVNEREAL